MDYESKLKKFILDNSIQAEHIHFEKSVHTVEEACAEANAGQDDIVKSICLVGGNQTIAALVLGSQRASTKRVAEALGISRPDQDNGKAVIRLATPQEILQRTGYILGGTPPFGYPATFLIDPTVMEKDIVYAGGGTPNAIIRISVKEIHKINRGKVVRIRK